MAHSLSYGLLEVPDINDVSISLCSVKVKQKCNVEKFGELTYLQKYCKNIFISGSVINTEYGVYGKASTNLKELRSVKNMPIAYAEEVELGYAELLTTIEGDNPTLYDVEIIEIIEKNGIKVGIKFNITDPILLGKTGGVIRGMSGSPIIQNGMMIGNICISLYPKTEGIGLLSIIMVKELN